MNYDFKQTLLSRCLLSGLLAGMIAVIVNFIFNYLYRVVSGYDLSEVVNVVSMIFSAILVTLAGGVLFFVFSKMNNGKSIYIAVMLVLTVLGMFAAFQTHRTANITNQHEFRILFSGLILIDGLFATFAVPYFVNHQKIYS